jgi:DNA replication and repair protein RecF
MAQAFNAPLAAAGAALVRGRLDWVATAADRFSAELESLGEHGPATLRYQGQLELAARLATTVGPHRDDLVLEVGGRRLRDYGSTGQQRSAAIALKLIEIASLRAARGTEPALLLDDVFAELDADRQSRLARRLLDSNERQVFITTPRREELPSNLDLPLWVVEGGKVR